ncbi:MAG TPA: hypothetical protein DEE98_06510 [Elusimicrobia bacterium]|nr:MAG: hypothetical protein A2278_06620 [Elusimicrobia bacterium RIFOXYA12_FULL_49_49]OGS10105.1 MAG: hypothetical protein A2204_06995 [Elusimicrobia bacterium RIFOXYA1_FULL_47_7]OGS16279.1 MAG: hypothetical protein A2251_01565 [Elusimicrobia bacterium RIFOXYA2_FULL_47_53]OGS26179.1 MAG: hypothetical protein A2339_02530 [Elusimicrobia bacterium RIFOXYB12_FULL_50_12]OGS31434.1 MAG: hypothetical protein A2323_09855 [Elusimicrobia bacterium RIFOXYB2_FULL_46_23]HBU70023.1 hypothetical protein [El
MKKILFFAFAVLAGFSACSNSGKIVAVIGKDRVTLGMIEERLKETPPAYRGYLDTQAGRKQFVDLIIRERLVMEDARRAGIAKRKDYIKSMNDFKADQARRLKEYEDNLKMEMFISDLHAKSIKASDEEVDKYYADHKKDYDRPVEISVRHILLPTREAAEAALKRVKAGEDFVKLVKELSTDTVSAPRGGEIGPFRKGELVPEFENAVFNLKLGRVSDIVETQFGYHIIKKISEKRIASKSKEETMTEIKRLVEKNKFDAWIEAQKLKYKLKVDYDLLKEIPVTPAEAEAAPAPRQGKTASVKN